MSENHMRHESNGSYGSTMTTAKSKRARRPENRGHATRASGTRHHRTAARRRALARLRSLFFQNSDLAQRYDMTFDRLVKHLWHARSSHTRLLLGSVNYVDDLIHAVACSDNNGLAWNDLPARHERTMVRRCRDGRDETESTVIVRRFVAELRRSTLDGRRCPLTAYAGTRPLRNWLADQLNENLRKRHRAAFVLDPGDSTCGAPLRFQPSSGTG
jgi:hypothetical protein